MNKQTLSFTILISLVFCLAINEAFAQHFPEKPVAQLAEEGTRQWVWSLAFSPDGRMLVLSSGPWGGGENRLGLWDVVTHKQVVALDVYGGGFRAAEHFAFSPDGRFLTAEQSADTGPVHFLWDIVEQKEIPGPFRLLTFSSDGETFAMGAIFEPVRLWDATEQRDIAFLEGYETYSEVTSVAFSPDGTTFATELWDGTVRLWDVVELQENPWEQQELAVLEGGAGSVFSPAISFSPDGKTLASVAGDNMLHLWDVAEQQQVGVLDDVRYYAFSADGKTLAVEGVDSVVLWDIDNQQEITGLPKERAAQFAFSPDGKTFATAVESGKIRLWDVVEQKEIAVLEGHTNQVKILVFSPDSRTLAWAEGISGDGVT